MQDDHAYYADAPGVPTPATVPVIRAVRIYTTRSASLLHVAAIYDTARTLYLAALHYAGNDTPVYLWRVPEGQPVPPTPDVIIWPTVAHKGDAMIMKVGGATGRDLHLYFGTHQAISGERDNDVQIAVVPNFLTAPGVPEAGEGQAFDPRGLGVVTPDPAPGYTLDQIAHAVLQAIKVDMGGELGNLVQQKAKNGAREAITVEQAAPGYLHTPDTLLQVLRDGLAPFSRDRAFEGATEALRKAGLPPKP